MDSIIYKRQAEFISVFFSKTISQHWSNDSHYCRSAWTLSVKKTNSTNFHTSGFQYFWFAAKFQKVDGVPLSRTRKSFLLYFVRFCKMHWSNSTLYHDGMKFYSTAASEKQRKSDVSPICFRNFGGTLKRSDGKVSMTIIFHWISSMETELSSQPHLCTRSFCELPFPLPWWMPHECSPYFSSYFVFFLVGFYVFFLVCFLSVQSPYGAAYCIL